jgi:hypothetical protein
MVDSINKQLAKNARVRATRKKKIKTPNKGQEKRCVDNFRDLGTSEVSTPLGFIDLVTDDYIIEFKIYTRAKDALGQILCYNHFISNKKLLIVLFGKGLATWKAYPIFEKLCSLYNVEVFKLSNVYKYKGLKIKLTSNKKSI